MAKRKPTESPPVTAEDATGRLIAVLQSLTQEVESLAQQAGKLSSQTQVLTEAIDDVRMEMEISCSYCLHFFQFTTGLGIVAHAATGFFIRRRYRSEQ